MPEKKKAEPTPPIRIVSEKEFEAIMNEIQRNAFGPPYPDAPTR